MRPSAEKESFKKRIENRVEKNRALLDSIHKNAEERSQPVLWLYGQYCRLNDSVDRLAAMQKEWLLLVESPDESVTMMDEDFLNKYNLLRNKFESFEVRFKNVQLEEEPEAEQSSEISTVSDTAKSVQSSTRESSVQESIRESSASEIYRAGESVKTGSFLAPDSPCPPRAVRHFDSSRLAILEPFCGSILHFPHFWALFEVLVDQTDLSDVEKFTLLKRSLGLEPLRLLSGLILPDYARAKQILHGVYTNQHTIKTRILYDAKLLKPAKSVKETSSIQDLVYRFSDFRKLVTDCDRNFETSLIQLIVSKFPESIVSRFVDSEQSRHVHLTLDSLIEHLHTLL